MQRLLGCWNCRFAVMVLVALPYLALTDATLATPFIVVIRDGSALPLLEAMCSPSRSQFDASVGLQRLLLPASCHLAGACTRVFSTALHGAAGNFTDEQLAAFRRCLPGGAVYYREPDLAVQKAEDEQHFRPDYAAGRRRGARRLLQTPGNSSQASFERNSAIDGGKIDMMTLAQGGVSLSAPTEKTQLASSKLWSLDRIDQGDLPLDGIYRYGSKAANQTGLGQGVTIYTLDSGIYKEHQEFGGLNGGPSRAAYGWSFVDNSGEAKDVDGHGSHVAGSAAGLQVGVAKGASVVAVRILDDTGMGSVSDTVAGLDWVAANAKKPAVVTMSLGVPVGSYSRSMEDAVKSLINNHGITVVVAAGNARSDACWMSPALVPEAITVAASDLATKYAAKGAQGGSEGVYVDSNLGACVDLFAPGVDIWSVCGGTRRCGTVSTNTYAYASGTSMATPHVAGAAAIYLAQHPQASPAEVAAALFSVTTPNKIDSSLLRPGTPNKILSTRMPGNEPTAVQAAQGPRQQP